jgi:hypothetical protein
VDKVSANLASRLEESDDDGVLEGVVELEASTGSVPVERGDRQATIAARKQAFREVAEPVEKAIRSGGGEVTGKAWINGTLRARLPARSIPRIAEQTSVTGVDVPSPLEPDAA